MLESLSKIDFELFLETLDTDRKKAAEKYVALRERLENFFEWRDCENTEELTDIVFDRAVKKIIEGEKIKNVEAFCVSIAKFVLFENRREVLRMTEIDENSTIPNTENANENDSHRKKLRCLDECMAKLSDNKRKLLVGYFETDEKTHIEKRRGLAEELGISINNLRIRISRLKSEVEKCTKKCCEKNS